MQCCVELLNIYDNIIIFGRDQDMHDKELGNVSKCFHDRQLMLNGEKKYFRVQTSEISLNGVAKGFIMFEKKWHCYIVTRE